MPDSKNLMLKFRLVSYEALKSRYPAVYCWLVTIPGWLIILHFAYTTYIPQLTGLLSIHDLELRYGRSKFDFQDWLLGYGLHLGSGIALVLSPLSSVFLLYLSHQDWKKVRRFGQPAQADLLSFRNSWDRVWYEVRYTYHDHQEEAREVFEERIPAYLMQDYLAIPKVFRPCLPVWFIPSKSAYTRIDQKELERLILRTKTARKQAKEKK